MENKKLFWTRFCLWVLFACVLPFAFIVWRFDLFVSVSKMQIGGWGMIAIIIVCVFAFTLARYVKAGMIKWSMTKQIISGVVKVIIPFVCLFLMLNAIKDNVDIFLQALAVVIGCEAIAIPINPMPEWVYIQSKGQTEDTIDYFLKRQSEYQNKGEQK